MSAGFATGSAAGGAAPGRRAAESLGRTLAKFVVPAALVSSLMGLVVFYGSIALAGAPDAAALSDASAQARTALTTFLVFVGLVLVVYVEPPMPWFVVVEPLTKDRRPTMLAIVLALAYVAVLLTPAAREFFSFTLPSPRDALLAAVAVLIWIPLVRLFWKRRLVDRFLGLR